VHRLPAGVAAILAALAATTAAVALGGALQPSPAKPVPAELAASIAKAQLQGTVASWCRGGFRPGGRPEYAVAVARERGGSYVVIGWDGAAVTLAAFSGGADLSCYTPAEARRLNRTIASSETISGRITPRWNTTVVCGFVESTSAACWQYSPSRREFVKIGDWTT